MSSTKIYFDNAASTHPKPESVYDAADSAFRLGGSPGRAAHQLALAASKTVFEARLGLAEFFKIKDPQRLVFTPGCTYGINMVLQRFPFERGDLVLVSALEHNAVMRPLNFLQKSKGIEVQSVPYCPGQIVDPEQLRARILARRPRLCAFLEASNVSGEILNLRAVAGICAEFEIPLLVDAAQTAGAFNADLDLDGISFWSTSGHKGLYGAPGLGLLYVADKFQLDPLVAGGTGSFSEGLEMPPVMPDRLEPGTMSAPSIGALRAGCAFVAEQGKASLVQHERELLGELLGFLSESQRFRVVGCKSTAQKVGLLSFCLEGFDSSLLAEVLDRNYGICVRAGLHCAAAAHRTFGSEKGGLVRVSFSAFNKREELFVLFDALKGFL